MAEFSLDFEPAVPVIARPDRRAIAGVHYVDPRVCDFPLSWTGEDGAIISYHFEADRVTAHTSGIAYCQRRAGTDPDAYFADLAFDLIGERSLVRR